MTTPSSHPVRPRTSRRRIAGVALGALLASGGAVAAFPGISQAKTPPLHPPLPPIAVSVTAAPSSVHPGGHTTVSGRCAPNSSGYAISTAFVHDPPTYDFGGVGAVPFETIESGDFSVSATVAATAAPGHYEVKVRCGGGLLNVSAPLDVVAKVEPTRPTRPPAEPEPPVKARPRFTG